MSADIDMPSANVAATSASWQHADALLGVADARQHAFRWLARSLKNPNNLPFHLMALFIFLLALFAFFAWDEAARGTKAMQGELNVLRADERPWVFAKVSLPWSPLVVKDDGAEIVLAFFLSNTGKAPARSVNIDGDLFYATGDSLQTESHLRSCDALRNRGTLAGAALFPNQEDQRNHAFTMDADGVKNWRNGKSESPGALMVAGCIDYVSGADTTHHQTNFIYQLNRPGPNRTILPIDSAPGQIAASDLSLVANPYLARDAD
jgi:hypothetical protein